MGMGGMTTDAYAAYASPTTKKNETSNTIKSSSSMTVAEYRNAINHISKYYDNWSIKSFIEDISIPAKTKIEVLCGKLVARVTNEDTWKMIFNNAKGV